MLENEKQLPKVYYARHITEGLVHYFENGQDRLYLVTNDALKKMNKSFEGKPVFVRHVDKIDLENLKEQADGYVSESFYNEFDGSWWVKFIAVSDRAQEAIKNGWAVSNAYLPTEYSGGGSYHDIDYQKEIKNGTYGHLAIVSNPRYEESVIMTPEEFKHFNEVKKQELEQLKNSKEKKMLSKEEMESLMSTIQNSLPEMIESSVKKVMEENAIKEKQNALDENKRCLVRELGGIAAKDESEMALSEKVNSIIGLAEQLKNSCGEEPKKEEPAKENEAEEPKKEEEPKENEAADEDKPADNECGKENEAEEKPAEEPKEEEKDNAAEEPAKEEKAEEPKENSKGFFEALKNAKMAVCGNKVSTMATGLQLGKDRYGKK